MTLEDKNTSHEQAKMALKTQSKTVFENEDLYKPDWKYWPKLHDNNMPKPYEDDPVFGKHLASTLPPIDLHWKAEPVVGSFSNIYHQPSGGNKVIFNEKIKWRAKSKIDSFQNINYKKNPSSPRIIPGKHYLPGGAELNLINSKYEYVGPKVGSLENADHIPGGGDVAIPHLKLNWKRKSRVGSLENIHHHPGGGEVYIMNQHLEWRSKPRVGSQDTSIHSQRSQNRQTSVQHTWDGRPRHSILFTFPVFTAPSSCYFKASCIKS
ncbi:hypothetical protein Btru_054263 [Bulinus truncatus]|nr:hypothetical protein Btru_054263 [Bulinus truncatus]